MPARWPRRQESVAVAESGLRGLPTPRPLRLWRLRSARLAPRSRLGGRGEPEGGPDDGGLAQRRGLQWAAERLRQRCGGEALMKPPEISPPPLCNRVGAAGCTRGGVATTDMTRKQRNINKMMKTMNTHKPRSTFLHAQSALGGDASRSRVFQPKRPTPTRANARGRRKAAAVAVEGSPARPHLMP